MSITPISTWMPGFYPAPQIQPFSYRAGEDYLEQIERLRQYVNTDLVDWVNTTFGSISSDLTDEVNTLIAAVNEQVDAIVNSSIIAQDSVVEGIVANPASATRIELATLFAPFALSATVTTLNTTVTTLNTLVTTGRLSDTSLQAEFATVAALATANTAITNNTTSINTLNTLVGTGRLSTTALNTAYAAVADLATANTAINSLNTLTSTGRLSDASLKLEFAGIQNGILDFTTVALLQTNSPVNTPQYAMANNAPGMLFRYDAGAWAAYGEGIFVSASARDTAITTPTDKMHALVAGMRMEYVGTFGSGGRWQKVGLIKPDLGTLTGCTAVVNDDGTVVITYTGTGNAILKNCNPALAMTDIVDIITNWKSPAVQAWNFKQANAGVTDATATGYDTFGNFYTQAGTTSPETVLNTSSWFPTLFSAATYLEADAKISVRHAMDPAKNTRATVSEAEIVITIGTAEDAPNLTLVNRNVSGTKVMDGYTFTATGAGVLTLKFVPRV